MIIIGYFGVKFPKKQRKTRKCTKRCICRLEKIMTIFSFLTLLGGLAIFLFGMNIMGEGLEKRSGSRLKSILENLTSSPIKGVLLGAMVTAVIQSSSATTVMVVGFVNSGLMKLSQSIGVIMGANIGTTVTAWLISLMGIEGDNVWINMLNPSNFSMVLAFIGVIFSFSKHENRRYTGSIFLGFAVLMMGMNMMTSAVKPLKDVPEFQNILLLFKNPLLGVLTGALLTAIIQSSSASVGILQALSVTGKVSYASAVPIIMGQNIGTCITAILSSIGANKNAKRAAVVHLCFNIIGTITFLIVFYAAHAIIHFTFINTAVNEAGIAIVHTTFNVFSTLVMLPFTKQLEKLAYIVIPDKNNAGEIQLLDERLIETPSVAVSQARKVTVQMMNLAQSTPFSAMHLLTDYNVKEDEKIHTSEKQIDNYEDKLGTYLVKLSRESLTMDDSHQISNLLHTIGDFERLGDHAVNLSKSAQEIHDKKIVFSPEATRELSVITDAVTDILKITAEAFEKNDLNLAAQIEPLEQVIDGLQATLKNRHIKRLQKNECTIETGFVFSDILTNYERIADHCSNIGVCLIEVADDKFDTHEFLHNFHHVESFEAQYKQYKEKYSV